MSVSNFLLTITLLFFFMTILKSALETNKTIRISTYYQVYKTQQIHEDYDFLEVLEKERKYYPIATLISLGAYLSSLLTKSEMLNNLLVLVVISVLGFSIFYLRPKKIT